MGVNGPAAGGDGGEGGSMAWQLVSEGPRDLATASIHSSSAVFICFALSGSFSDRSCISYGSSSRS